MSTHATNQLPRDIDLNRRQVRLRRLAIEVESLAITERYGAIKLQLLALENGQAALSRELAELDLYEAENWPNRELGGSATQEGDPHGGRPGGPRDRDLHGDC